MWNWWWAEEEAINDHLLTVFGREDIVTNINTVVFMFINHEFVRYRVWRLFICPTPPI